MEIERKYVVSIMPNNLEKFNVLNIEQGYLCKNPIIRIRRSNDDYILTYKNKINNANSTAIINEEAEFALDEKAYQHLKDKIDNNLILKKRYIIPIDNGVIVELDVFGGKLKGLCFAEIEFPDEITADKYIPPAWIGEDVTLDKRYDNYYLSKLDSYEEFIKLY